MHKTHHNSIRVNTLVFLFIIILALGQAAACAGQETFAINGREVLYYGDYAYTLEDGLATIVFCNSGVRDIVFPERPGTDDAGAILPIIREAVPAGENEPFILTIPGFLDGFPVAFIGDEAFLETTYTDYALPEGLIGIGDYAFAFCYYLKTLSLPDSVMSIGDGAFEWCESLTDLSIPAGVTDFGHAIVAGCESIALTVRENSAAHFYALENDIPFVSEPNEASYKSLEDIQALLNDLLASSGTLTDEAVSDFIAFVAEAGYYLFDDHWNDHVFAEGLGEDSLISPRFSESGIGYDVHYSALRARLQGRLSEAYDRYLTLCEKYFSAYIVDDLALMMTWEDMAHFLIDWSVFRTSYPRFLKAEIVDDDIRFGLFLYAGCFDLVNTPVIDENRLSPDVKASYEMFLSHPSSGDCLYYDDIAHLYDMWKTNDFMYTEQVQAAIKALEIMLYGDDASWMDSESPESDIFGELDGNTFCFSSGVGAWSTEITFSADGVFAGYFHDADMGDIGEGYPSGTLYECLFSGQFALAEQWDAYTFVLTLDTLNPEEPAGIERIKDGVRVITEDPYGINGGDLFMLYSPGRETADLPEAFIEWVCLPNAWETMPETLPFYGLFNIEAEAGFCSY